MSRQDVSKRLQDASKTSLKAFRNASESLQDASKTLKIAKSSPELKVAKQQGWSGGGSPA